MSAPRPPLTERQAAVFDVIAERGCVGQGVSLAEVAEQLGKPRQAVKEIIARLRRLGIDIRTKRIGESAYVYSLADAGIGGNPFGRTDIDSPSMRTIIARAEDAGAKGAPRTVLCAGISDTAADRAMSGLTKRGTLTRVRYGSHAVYYLRPEWAAAAKRAFYGAAARAKSAGRKHQHGCVPSVQPAFRVQPSSVFSSPDDVDYSRAKVTICPGTPESRWQGPVPRFFSSLALGSYLPADTWAARVYGAERDDRAAPAAVT